jgi:hypothetical protein
LKNLNEFTLKEIATIFWIFHSFKAIDNDKITLFEKSILNILDPYLKDKMEKIEDMGYDTHVKYYDQYKIDPYDVEAINSFILLFGKYKGKLLGVIEKTLQSIKLENTHPISRKWFYF